MYNDEDKITAVIIVTIVFLLVLGGFAWHACSIADQATLGRAEEAVKTKNFEESVAYQQGLRRDFDELLLAYWRAKSEEEQKTILAVMAHRASGVRRDLIPADVQSLLKSKGMLP